MQRNRIYRTWSVVTTLVDVQALAPHADLEELTIPFMTVYAEEFGADLLGLTYDPKNKALILCLKHKYQAEEVVKSWRQIVDYIRESMRKPNSPK